MSEWWTYRISDFLMYAPATYWRQVELHNARFWPAPLVAWLAGIVVALLLARGTARSERMALALLALAWAWVGAAFFAVRMAQIHLAAPYLAAACAAQALVLAVVAAWPDTQVRESKLRWALLGAAAFAAVAYPAIGWFAGRPVAQAEVFGWMPDPTAWVTFAGAWALRHAPPWRRVAIALLPGAFIVAGVVNHATMAQ